MNTTFETKIDEANRAFQDGDLDGAARRCADILEVAPDHAGAHALLGTIRLSSGEFGAAAMSFRRAIASDPGAFEARRGLGVALASLGHPDDAVASFRAALAIEPNHAEAHYDLGVLFLESGQLADATDSLSKAIEARPDFTEEIGRAHV